MEVAAVDERDVDRGAPQLPNRLQAAETPAHDDDVVIPGRDGADRAHEVLHAHGLRTPAGSYFFERAAAASSPAGVAPGRVTPAAA
jgi:hypothetical protein